LQNQSDQAAVGKCETPPCLDQHIVTLGGDRQGLDHAKQRVPGGDSCRIGNHHRTFANVLRRNRVTNIDQDRFATMRQDDCFHFYIQRSIVRWLFICYVSNLTRGRKGVSQLSLYLNNRPLEFHDTFRLIDDDLVQLVANMLLMGQLGFKLDQALFDG
jgi:hypothetical protein